MKVAIALSNTGVALLERRAYSEALAAFKASTAAMDTIFGRMEDLDQVSLRELLASFYSKLDVLVEALPEAAASSSPSSTNPTLTLSLSYVDVDFAFLKALLQDQSPVCLQRPIRLKDYDIIEHENLVSAIILFNGGLAHSAASLTESSRNLFTLAISSLRAKDVSFPCEALMTMALFLFSLVLDNLAGISGLLGTADGELFRGTLREAKATAARALEYMTSNKGSFLGTTAAAA
jgi:hypothetical protein